MTDWKVTVQHPALRGLNRLPVKAAWAVVQFLDERLTTNPLRATKPLNEPLAGLRSGNVGHVRVLVWINDEAREVVVVRIEHRSTAYSRPL